MLDPLKDNLYYGAIMKTFSFVTIFSICSTWHFCFFFCLNLSKGSVMILRLSSIVQKSNHFLTISCIIHKAHWWSRLNWARKVPSWKWETKMGDMGDIVVGSGPVVIFDILEPPAFNKYSSCWFFKHFAFVYLYICVIDGSGTEGTLSKLRLPFKRS